MSRRALLRTPRPRPGPRLARAASAVTLVALLLGGAASAQDATTTTTTEPEGAETPLPPLGELPELSPGLAGVELTSATYDQVEARRDEVAADLEDAERREVAQGDAIVAATARDAELTDQIAEARARAERWEAEADRLDEEVRAVAVDAYMRGSGGETSPLLALDPDAHDRMATTSITSESLTRRQVADLEEARTEGRRARSEETLSTAIREGVRESLAAARIARDEARAEKERLSIELVDATRAIEGERRLATVVGTEFPLVVLEAYWKAAETMRLLAPGCGIQWWALAGIGKIESGHGTYAGSEVRADGSLTKPIIGIPLTGANGTAAIGDSDGGLIDGDPGVDRAAGPMQFIPQTWRAYGVDGDQNGRIEIQNIYDAAAGAARYLCAAAGSMADVAGLQRGYFAYNHSAAYVSSVLAQAVRYGNAVPIKGVPGPPAAPPPPEAPGTGTTTTTTTTTAPA